MSMSIVVFETILDISFVRNEAVLLMMLCHPDTPCGPGDGRAMKFI